MASPERAREDLLNLLADVPGHARFAIDLSSYWDLPLDLEADMLDQIAEWRSREK